ncbi:unnamed protein product, partial [Sphagnum troendelagicum]
VEDINKRREPLPTLDAIYFIQSSAERVKSLIEDMSGTSALYKKSVTLATDFCDSIQIKIMFYSKSSQGFTTGNTRTFERFFGEYKEGSHDFDECIQIIASRLSTVFFSMKEFPFVRYHAPKSTLGNTTTSTITHDPITAKLANALWEQLMRYKGSTLEFPHMETCELIIVDRSIDLVAPVIHEWTYDAMCHDLLDLDGNNYTYEVSTNHGKKEHKEVLLEEHDPIWLEIRDLHIADACLRLTEKLQQFGSKNEVAHIQLNTKNGQEISTKDMQKMAQALPRYRDQLDKLSLHIHVTE